MKHKEHVYSEEQRQALIYLLSYSTFEELSLFHFQDFLEISKGTAITDAKKLRKYLAKQNIELVYSRKKGFFLLEMNWKSVVLLKILLLV